MKIVKWVVGLAIAGVAIYGITKDLIRVNTMDFKSVSYNGWLSVEDGKLVNQHHDEVQFMGISTHGIQWFGDLYTRKNIEKLKREMGVNIFRIAMYVDPSDDGYVSNKELKEKVKELVDISVELDMYVVVDWHILNDNNPTIHQSEALEFFGEMAEAYKDTPNVIYEICNEPNGNTTWDDIKGYATAAISEIRSRSPKSVVIVGIPGWSREVSPVAVSPLEFENVMYAVHFYAGSDNQTLREKIDYLREQGLAVFVSECGATDSSGDGKIYTSPFNRWIDYLNEKKISWIYWSFSNKDEASAILRPEYGAGSDEDLMEYLSESGKLLKNYLKAEETEVDDAAAEELLKAE